MIHFAHAQQGWQGKLGEKGDFFSPGVSFRQWKGLEEHPPIGLRWLQRPLWLQRSLEQVTVVAGLGRLYPRAGNDRDGGRQLPLFLFHSLSLEFSFVLSFSFSLAIFSLAGHGVRRRAVLVFGHLGFAVVRFDPSF